MHGECNNYILHAVQPHLMRQEMLLRTPDPLSTFQGRGPGHKTRMIVSILLWQLVYWLTTHQVPPHKYLPLTAPLVSSQSTQKQFGTSGQLYI